MIMSPKSIDGRGRRAFVPEPLWKGSDGSVRVGVILRLTFPSPFCTKTVNATVGHSFDGLYRVRKALPSTRAVTLYLW